MNVLFVAASAAALLTAAGTVPSLAQSSSSSGASSSSMTMPSITCRDLFGMDHQTARNVVFYLGGLHAASGASSAMNSTTSTSDTTGSVTAAGSGSDASSAAGGSAVMAQLPGFSTINADQIISACQSSPDKQLSEVLGAGGATAQ